MINLAIIWRKNKNKKLHANIPNLKTAKKKKKGSKIFYPLWGEKEELKKKKS